MRQLRPLAVLAVVVLAPVAGVVVFATPAACTTITGPTTITSPGCYVLGADATDSTADPFVTVNASDVVLDGAGHTVDSSGGGTAILVQNDTGRLSNVTVANLTTTDWRNSIEVRGVDDLTIAAVTLSPDRTAVHLDDVTAATVRDSEVTEGDDTLHFDSVTDVTVENVTVRAFRGNGLDAGGTNVSVLDSTFRDAGNTGKAIRLTAGGGRVERNFVTNLSDSVGGDAIAVQGDDVAIRNNTVTDTTGTGITTFNNAGGPVADNVLRRNAIGLVVSGTGHRATNNTMTDNDYGLRLAGSGPSVLRNNTMAGNLVNFDPSWFQPYDVDASNTVAGDPIRYVNDTSVVTIDGSQPAGFVFAFNVTSIDVRDLHLDAGSVEFAHVDGATVTNVTAVDGDSGFAAYESANLTYSRVTAARNARGIELRQVTTVGIDNATVLDNDRPALSPNARAITAPELTTGLTIVDSTVRNGTIGLYLFSVSNVTVARNDVSDFSTGVKLDRFASNADVFDNVVRNTTTAVHFEFADTSNLTDNDLSRNGQSVRAFTSPDLTITGNNMSANAGRGIALDDTDRVVVANNTVSDNGADAIGVTGAGNEVRNNTVQRNAGDGISVSTDSAFTCPAGHVVADNLVTDNAEAGLRVSACGSTFANNTVERNGIGLALHAALQELRNDTFRDNAMADNGYELFVAGTRNDQRTFEHDVDRSNTVDGKPIEWHVDERNVTVDAGANAGFVALVNVTTATVDGVVASNVSHGVLVVNSTDVVVQNVTTTDTYDGVVVLQGTGPVTVQGVSVQRAVATSATVPQPVVEEAGVGVASTGNVTVRNNLVTDSGHGVLVDRSRDVVVQANELTGNTIAGVTTNFAADGNAIYNNYLENANNVDTASGTNRWNTTRIVGANVVGGPELGGNFWANPSGTGFSQTCTDADGDGFCDSARTVAFGTADQLPLSLNFSAGAGSPSFAVSIASTTSPVTEGTALDVTAQVTNTGGSAGTQTVALSAVGTPVDSTTVSLASGASTAVTLSWATAAGDAGSYTATVTTANGSASTPVQVDPASGTPTPTPTPGSTATPVLSLPADPGDPHFDVRFVEVSESVAAGDRLNATVAVRNTGGDIDTRTVALVLDGTRVDETDVRLAAGEVRRMTLSWATTAGDAGEHVLAVRSPDDEAARNVTVVAAGSATPTVTATPTATASPAGTATATPTAAATPTATATPTEDGRGQGRIPGFGGAAALLAVALVGAALLLRRRG